MMEQRETARRKKLLRTQKLLGFVIVLICVAYILIAAHGTTAEDRDATGTVLLLPMGIYLLFTKEICIGG